MNKIHICPAIFATVLLGFNLNLAHAEPSAKIDFGVLDLRKPQDVATLYSRIERRAASVCNDASSSWDVRRIDYLKKCTDGAIDAAVASANVAALTALHEAKRSKALAVAVNP